MLAARRAGIHRVVVPKANQTDLRELPDSVRQELEFVLAERIEDVLLAVIPDLAGRLAAAGARRGRTVVPDRRGRPEESMKPR